MNFTSLTADVVKILPVHFTQGRAGHIQGVTIHHNAGNLTVEQCYNIWLSRPASAHYQVESSGRIGQLVWDNDTAWHAGNAWANSNTIGIEHADFGDGFTDECIDNGAHLVAALCLHYNLGEPKWLSNVFPHSHFSPTACPAGLQTSYRDRYMNVAVAWYDKMRIGDTAQSATVSTSEEEKDMFIVVPDEMESMFLVAGGNVSHIPDLDCIEALNQVYSSAYGRGIPTVRLGTKDAPYGMRFFQSLGQNALNLYTERAKAEGR